mmetsp:Transcript_7623/g.13979  ORF Transcript_7623/g.13979 Transcript_7623/m.13979 type:complete len:97 (+) Transcript_7623:58-348(+)
MTVSKQEEPEIAVSPVDSKNAADANLVTAVATEETSNPTAGGGSNEAPIPAGHSRFYCSKCRTPYDLPDRATSWRCANCHQFNSTQPGECEWCSIL